MENNLQKAVQSFLVNCVGAGFLAIIYFTLSLLHPYLIPLFWATVLSIPLFEIKKVFVDYIEEDLKDDEITLFGVLLTTLHVIFGFACNPFYFVFCTFFKAYTSVVHKAFDIKSSYRDSPSPTKADANVSPGKNLAEKSLQEQKDIVSDKLKKTFDTATFFYYRLVLSFGTGMFLYDLLFVKQASVIIGFLIIFLMVLHLLFLTLYRLFSSYIPRVSNKTTKKFVLDHASSILTYFIVFGAITTIAISSVIVSYHCVNEFQMLTSNSIAFVDEHLQGDLKTEMHAQLSKAYEYGTNYLDEQSFMKGANVTTLEIKSKVESVFNEMPMVQSIYYNVTHGQLSVLFNKTALTLAIQQLTSNAYSEKEISFLAQIKSAASTFVSSVAQNAVRTGLNVFNSMLSVVSSLFDWFFKIILFLTVLLYLVNNKHSIIYYLGNMLEVVDPKHFIVSALEVCISSTFSVNLRLAFFYFLFSNLSFCFVGLSVTYIPSIIGSMLAILPFINPIVIVILPALTLWLQGSIFKAVLLILGHVWATFVIIPLFYEEIKGIDSYFGSLAIALGIYTYGLEGVIVGPLLMALLPAGYKILRFYLVN